jgi:hypothetical protein
VTWIKLHTEGPWPLSATVTIYSPQPPGARRFCIRAFLYHDNRKRQPQASKSILFWFFRNKTSD